MPGLRASLGRMHWSDIAERAQKRHRDGLERLPDDPDGRQKQLTRVANAAWAVGLARLAEERRDEAEPWLREAASRYRESFADAPPGSWGRLMRLSNDGRTAIYELDLGGGRKIVTFVIFALEANGNRPE